MRKVTLAVLASIAFLLSPQFAIANDMPSTIREGLAPRDRGHANRLTMGSSLSGAIVSGLMWRRAGPLIHRVLFEQDCAKKPNNGVLVGNDADDINAAQSGN